MTVMVYYGSESFLLENAVQQIRTSIVNPAMGGLGHRVLHTPSLADVLEAVGSVSLALGSKTLIEIQQFSLMHQAVSDPVAEKQVEELKEQLTTVDENKVILFTGSKIDRKIKFPKWISKHPQVEFKTFDPFKFWEVDKAADFLIQYAQQQEIALPPDTADLLVQLIGTDLRQLTNEVQKLGLYAIDRPITPDDVFQLSNHADNLFKLVDRWILQQEPATNYHDLHEILLKKHPVEVFAILQSYFNNMFRVCWLHAHGMSANQIADQTKQKAFTVNKHLRTFSHVPVSRWVALKHQLVTMEWKTKTGQLEGQLALEMALGA